MVRAASAGYVPELRDLALFLPIQHEGRRMQQSVRFAPMSVRLGLSGDLHRDGHRGAILKIHHFHLDEDEIGLLLVQAHADVQLGRARAAGQERERGNQ